MSGGNIINSRQESWLEQEPENSLNHKCEVERVNWKIMRLWHSKSTLSDILPLAKPYFLNLPK